MENLSVLPGIFRHIGKLRLMNGFKFNRETFDQVQTDNLRKNNSIQVYWPSRVDHWHTTPSEAVPQMG